MATNMRLSFGDIFLDKKPFLREVFYEEWMEPEGQLNRIFNMEGSSTPLEQTTGITGLPLGHLTPEGQAVTYEQLFQDFDKDYEHVKYTLGSQVTEETVDDDPFGPFKNVSRALGRSMRTTQNIYGWNVLINGLPTVGTETTPDGVSIFNTAHVLHEGGPYGSATYSNTASADLDITALENAKNSMRRMVDQRGLMIRMRAQSLIVPPELEWLAAQIIRSPDMPTTANRSINPAAGYLEIILSEYLTGATDWFVFAAPGDHKMMFFTRKAASFETAVEFDTGTAKMKSVMRFVAGGGDWRGVYGAEGS